MVALPRQTETSAPALITGSEFTVTMIVSFPVQVLLVVVTMYVVVKTGVAVGFTSVALFRVPAGLQRYPVTVLGAVGFPPSVVLLPIQMEIFAPAFVGTLGETEIVMVSLFAQPFTSTMFTVYDVVTLGVETGFEIFGLLRLPEGDQTYVVPFTALRVVLNPGQTQPGFGPAFASGRGFTVTRTVSMLVQEFALVIVTV